MDSVNVEWSINQALNALDELIAFANKPETVEYLESNKRFVGMIKTRSDLLASFLMARKTPQFKIVTRR